MRNFEAHHTLFLTI